MSAPDFASIKRALSEARSRSGEARTTWLEALGAEDPALHAEVVSLLAHEHADTPIAAVGDLGARVGEALHTHPERVGPYRVVDVLGEGGMGVVYRAEQAEPRREVALKLMRTTMASPVDRARFEAEVETLVRLDHPHVAAVLDAGRADTGQPYLVMPLVDGVPITAFCDEGQLGVLDRVRLLLTVCDGVRHAHQRGIVHRDLKPSNILVSVRDGAPWPTIIDFGIAKRAAATETLTMAGQVIGTPAYMSPEQAGAHGGIVDTRTDVYALGVVLHELLTGTRPHHFEDTRPESIREVLTGASVARPSERAADPKRRRALAGDLDTIVLMALRSDPERRYPSVEALADDLRRHLEGLPVHAQPDRWTYRAGRFVRRHRAAVTTAAIVVIASVATITTLLVQDAALRDERNRALAAEAAAVREAQTTQQVADFLVGLFALVDPAEREGEEMTARELLAAGTASLDDQLQDDPVVRAKVLETIADVHLSLGDYPQARPLAQEALTLWRAEHPEGHPAIATVLETLSTLAHDEGDYAEAITRAEEALAVLEGLGQGEGQAAATLVNDLAISLDALGRYEAAEARYRDALARQTALLGADHPDTVWALNTLGQAVTRQGRWVEGSEIFARAVAQHRTLFEGPHPDLAASLNNLGGVRLWLDQADAGAEALAEALAIYRELYDEGHAAVGRGIANLGLARRLQGRHDEALDLLRQAEGVQRSAVGEAHPLRLGPLAALGEGLALAGDPSGRSMLEEAHRLTLQGLGPDHPRSLAMDARLATLDWASGDLVAAAARLDRVLAVRAAIGRVDPRAAIDRLDRAAVAWSAVDPDEVDRQLAQTSALDGLPEDHWARAYHRALRGLLAGSPAEATAEALARRFGVGHPRATTLQRGR